MPEQLDRLIKFVYRKWKGNLGSPSDGHPDEETLACFLDGRLSESESVLLKEHLICCNTCSEAASLYLKIKNMEPIDAPKELINTVKGLLNTAAKDSLLEIVLRLRETAWQVINTTGDILFGQEVIPAPVLRSRQIPDFKDEVMIFKDFKDIRVEVKIENKSNGRFNLNILIKEKQTQHTIKDLRVSLLREDVELDSYLTESGKVIFENVLFGNYRIEISTIDNKLAAILLDIHGPGA